MMQGSNEDREKFLKWLAEAAGLEGVWLRDDWLGVEIRIERFIARLIDNGWAEDKALEERDRLYTQAERFRP